MGELRVNFVEYKSGIDGFVVEKGELRKGDDKAAMNNVVRIVE